MTARYESSKALSGCSKLNLEVYIATFSLFTVQCHLYTIAVVWIVLTYNISSSLPRSCKLAFVEHDFCGNLVL